MIADMPRASYRPSDLISFGTSWFLNGSSGLVGTCMLRLKASCFGVSLGRRVRCYGPIHLVRAPLSTIRIGDDVSMVSSSRRCTAGSIYAPVKLHTHTPSAAIVIGDRVGLNGTTIVARTRRIDIGEGTMIAPNVLIMDSDFHALWPPESRLTTPAIERDRNVQIGRNTWIASSCIILKGAVIGENSVIAAGSVVTSAIPENALAGGVPARVIRQLHTPPSPDEQL